MSNKKVEIETGTLPTGHLIVGPAGQPVVDIRPVAIEMLGALQGIQSLIAQQFGVRNEHLQQVIEKAQATLAQGE